MLQFDCFFTETSSLTSFYTKFLLFVFLPPLILVVKTINSMHNAPLFGQILFAAIDIWCCASGSMRSHVSLELRHSAARWGSLCQQDRVVGRLQGQLHHVRGRLSLPGAPEYHIGGL